MLRHKKLFIWCCFSTSALVFICFQVQFDFSGDSIVKYLFNFKSVKLQPRQFFGISGEYNYLFPSNFECSSFYTTNTTLLKEYTRNRISIDEEPHLSMNCENIQRRITGNREFNRSKNTFSVARNVYQDYYLQEILLSYTFSPYNFYCYALDSKSSVKFVEQMKTLAGCLDNVIILNETFSFDSAGHYQNHAHFACMEKLLKYPSWKYVTLLQNLDVLMKTTEEISHIIDIFGGAPYIGFEKAFTRRLVKKYGVDEMLIPTLLSSNFLKLPSQVENRCRVRDYLRYVHWNFGNVENCKSKKKRHAVCLLGVEYLKTLRDSVHLVANKIWPQFDFGAVVCIGEMLYQRSIKETLTLEEHFYRNLPQVREIREKEKGAFNMTSFKC